MCIMFLGPDGHLGRHLGLKKCQAYYSRALTWHLMHGILTIQKCNKIAAPHHSFENKCQIMSEKWPKIEKMCKNEILKICQNWKNWRIMTKIYNHMDVRKVQLCAEFQSNRCCLWWKNSEKIENFGIFHSKFAMKIHFACIFDTSSIK